MLNLIWLGFILIGIIVAGASGHIDAVTNAALDSAKTSVNICFDLVGIMVLWLGIMKVAEKAGMVELLCRAIRPLVALLFPEIPPNHPALGTIIMNISANVLGLGNAATPFGLKAMKDLQTLNRYPDEATDAMCTFLGLNTSCLTLIPATMISIRVASGSANPTEIVGPTIFASGASMIVAIAADRVFRWMSRRKGR